MRKNAVSFTLATMSCVTFVCGITILSREGRDKVEH